MTVFGYYLAPSRAPQRQVFCKGLIRVSDSQGYLSDRAVICLLLSQHCYRLWATPKARKRPASKPLCVAADDGQRTRPLHVSESSDPRGPGRPLCQPYEVNAQSHSICTYRISRLTAATERSDPRGQDISATHRNGSLVTPAISKSLFGTALIAQTDAS